MLVEAYYRLHLQWCSHQRCALFLVEVQVAPRWKSFARRLRDTENIKLFVPGPSAKLLSRELATSMRGRTLEAVVTPFSFHEALRHAGHEPAKQPAHFTKADHSQLAHDVLQYLAVGGFPEAQWPDTRTHAVLLCSYVDVVLLRDVLERHNLRQPQMLRWLMQQLLGNAAGSFSINHFHADLRSRGAPIGKDTLHHMLAHLEDAFFTLQGGACH